MCRFSILMYNNESFEIIKKWPDDQENLLLFEISVFAKPLNIGLINIGI